MLTYVLDELSIPIISSPTTENRRVFANLPCGMAERRCIFYM